MNQISEVKRELRLRQWAEEVARCQQSGLKVAEWCRQNNIKTKNYYYHLKAVREHSLQLLPAELPQNPAAQAMSEAPRFRKLDVERPCSGNAPITVHLPYASVDIQNGASDETLRAVLDALKISC